MKISSLIQCLQATKKKSPKFWVTTPSNFKIIKLDVDKDTEEINIESAVKLSQATKTVNIILSSVDIKDSLVLKKQSQNDVLFTLEELITIRYLIETKFLKLNSK